MSLSKKRAKRYAALFLAALLSCSCVMGSYQKSYAMAVGAVVTAGEAVAFLLAAFGIVAASVAVYQNADSIKAWGEKQLEEFKLYASGFVEVTGKTAEELSADIDAWTALAVAGTLNKASYVYDIFKKWCEGLALDDTAHGVGEYLYAMPEENIYAYRDLAFMDSDSGNLMYHIHDNEGEVYTFLCAKGSSYSIMSISLYPFSSQRIIPSGADRSAGSRVVHLASSDITYYTLGASVYRQNLTSYKLTVVPSALSTSNSSFNDYCARFLVEGLVFGSFAVTESVASKVIARDRAIANVDIVPADAIADVGVETVPIDWAKIRSVSGALSDVVEGVSTIDSVLNQVGVEVIDKTGAITVPVPPADMDDFTLAGLETLFPFCIPFDLIDFFQVLSAEPVAPHFQWPIRYMTPDGPKEYVIDIDLSAFDSVASLLRTMELLVFIVGLIMITREKMIRG